MRMNSFRRRDSLTALWSSQSHNPAACSCALPRPASAPCSTSDAGADAPDWAWVEAAFSYENLLTYFQPIVHTASGKTAGYETLMRSGVPSRYGTDTDAVVGAGELIAACRKWNVLPWMDKRARLASVRAVAAAMALEGNRDDEGQIRYFINFLPSIVYNPAVCLQTTMAEAAKYDVPPARLVFEVSESEKIQNMTHLQNILAYYRDNGAQTAVDDLGMGYATADYLPRLRPDYLKISLEWLHRAENDMTTRRATARFSSGRPRFGNQNHRRRGGNVGAA